MSGMFAHLLEHTEAAVVLAQQDSLAGAAVQHGHLRVVRQLALHHQPRVPQPPGQLA